MCNTREEPSNEGWRTIVGDKGTRDRLHECDDDSTRMLSTRVMMLPHRKGPMGTIKHEYMTVTHDDNQHEHGQV